MIEIQCPSCQTRYRLDAKLVPESNPTFKCSRCGHVFVSDAAAKPADKPVSAKPTGAEKTEKSVSPEKTGKPAVAPQPPADSPSSPPPPAQSPPKAAIGKTPASEREYEPQPQPLKPRQRSKGDNLSFDFSDYDGPEIDEETTAPGQTERWSVGDHQGELTGEPSVEDEDELFEPQPILIRRNEKRSPFGRAAERTEKPADIVQPPREPKINTSFPDDDEEDEQPPRAPRASEQAVHSSGTLLLVFMAFAVMFSGISYAIRSNPESSRDILAGIPQLQGYFSNESADRKPVELSEVKAEYKMLNDNQLALVISGKAENRNSGAFHTVQLAISLIDGQQRELASQIVYCGNMITGKMLDEMTPRELEFFQKVDPPRNYSVKPGETAPFVGIFLNPPAGPNTFRVKVLKTLPAANPPSPSSAS